MNSTNVSLSSTDIKDYIHFEKKKNQPAPSPLKTQHAERKGISKHNKNNGLVLQEEVFIEELSCQEKK